MTRDRALQILDLIDRSVLFVVGDLMLDHYVWGTARRLSPEAPVPVVEVQREDFHAGGAANVAANAVALRARVRLIGAVGQDDAGTRLLSLLEKLGVDCALVDRTEHPTTVKTRVVADRQQIVRYDRELRVERPEMTKYINTVADDAAVVVSDYDKGVVTPFLLQRLARCRCSVLDPKPRPTGYNFQRFTAITPNRKEALDMSGAPTVEKASVALATKHRVQHVLTTLGADGMKLYSLQAGGGVFADVPARSVEVFDVSGAGDTAAAVFTLALSVGATAYESAVLANTAAGIVVGKIGTATVTPEEIAENLAP